MKTPATAREALNTAISETQLQDAILDAAEKLGWLRMHTRPGRTADGWRTPLQGDKGFPDLVLARGEPKPGLLLIELKSQRGGKTTPEQRTWIKALGEAGADVRIWRPSDWTSGLIERALA